MHARLLALLLALVTLASCAGPTPTARQEQTVDGLTIGLEASDNAQINSAQTFVVTLADAAGQPVEGAAVYLDMTMTQMPMGTNRPVAAAAGGGRYRAAAAYTMAGPWEIVVVAEVAGVERRAVFKREVVK